MKTTKTMAFSLPFKVIEKLRTMADRLYNEGKIGKPTASEAVSYVLAKELADLPKPGMDVAALTREHAPEAHTAGVAQPLRQVKPQAEPAAAPSNGINEIQADVRDRYIAALEQVRGIKATWKQIANAELRFEHPDWRLNIGPRYYDPLRPNSVVGLLYGEDGELIPEFPAVEIGSRGRLALPAIHSYLEDGAPDSLQPYPYGRTAFDAALFADFHIRKQGGLRLRRSTHAGTESKHGGTHGR